MSEIKVGENSNELVNGFQQAGVILANSFADMGILDIPQKEGAQKFAEYAALIDLDAGEIRRFIQNMEAVDNS